MIREWCKSSEPRKSASTRPWRKTIDCPPVATGGHKQHETATHPTTGGPDNE
jgi:hypothetical protein